MYQRLLGLRLLKIQFNGIGGLPSYMSLTPDVEFLLWVWRCAMSQRPEPISASMVCGILAHKSKKGETPVRPRLEHLNKM
jgi:hypothetical protein